MNSAVLQAHKWRNVLHSVLLLSAMAGLLALVGWSVGGAVLMLWVLVLAVPMLLMAPSVSPRMLLSLYDASELTRADVPQLYDVTHWLAQKAQLSAVPRLYYIPTQVLNAVTVGSHKHAVIALTDGLLRQLNLRELTGVIGYEMSHIKNNDMWVMSLADFITRTTNILSSIGQMMVIISIPLLLFTDMQISILALLLLLLAPSISALMQLALSRTREFDADLDAVRLTNDPRGLASALAKLEYHDRRFLQRVIWPTRQSEPSVLRSHPHTELRIRKLLQWEAENTHNPFEQTSIFSMPPDYPVVTRKPGRRFLSGLWH